jgi:2-oxoglutarate ferredoxin oxidoreductase subunit gamma
VNKIEVRLAGLGGQGIVLAGRIFSMAAAYDGKNVLQTQSYGAEARGSLAKADIIVSNQKIGFPTVRKCDVLVAMNQEALNKYLKDLKDDGVLIVDSTNVKIPKTKAKVFKIPATEEAEKLFKSKIHANMLMLGALAKIVDLTSKEAIERALKETLPQNSYEINKRAFEAGKNLVH